jgi:hypothetical protein
MSVVEDILGPSTYSIVAQLFELVEIRLLNPLLLQMLLSLDKTKAKKAAHEN